MVGRDCDVRLRSCEHPEFDAWRWHEYWVPLDSVIEFKREVYNLALNELSRLLFARSAEGARYLRQRVRHERDGDADAAARPTGEAVRVEGQGGGAEAPRIDSGYPAD
jgi:putative (di)nucleoside polyphosphate hydrolase